MANTATTTTTYQIVADSARTFALRNKATGQFDHEGFPTKALIRKFWNLHFSWRAGFKLEEAV